ncbi:hypothetical protein GOP47_0023226 [Adiantum capillus-veneris]|uniref:Uncharacterized protein n=1 Tax=Adiantum capillus-veneris TaxID=13818 RepID=A0A9D4U7C2_ADICA|nr:hypothetical protein GOP47_0023226 [Adiantum capillus-veneris]
MSSRLQKPTNAISGKGELGNDWSSRCMPILGQLWLAAQIRSKFGHVLAVDSASTRDVQHLVCKRFVEAMQCYWSSLKNHVVHFQCVSTLDDLGVGAAIFCENTIQCVLGSEFLCKYLQ